MKKLLSLVLIAPVVQAEICVRDFEDRDCGSLVIVEPVSLPKKQESLNKAVAFADSAYKIYDGKKTDLLQEAGTCHLLRGKTPFGYADDAGFVTQKGNEIWISFHGTKGLGDVVTDLKIAKTSLASLGLEGRAHTGFLERYISVRKCLLDTLNFFSLTPNTRIHFTGHSLGGALATISAGDIKNQFQDCKVSLTTFCSPRVMDIEGASQITDLLGQENIQRVWRSGDPISTVSPGWMGYKHIGQTGGYQLGAKFWGNFGQNHSHRLMREDAESKAQVPLIQGYQGKGGLWIGFKRDVHSSVKSVLESASGWLSTVSALIGWRFT